MTEQEEYELYSEANEYERYRRPTASKTVPRQDEGISGVDALQATLEGVGQGLTFGAMDELQGAVGTPFHMHDKPELSMQEAYAVERDRARARLAESQQKAPVISAISDMVGSLGSGAMAYKTLGKPNTLLGSAALGGAEGALNAAGRSDDLESGLARTITDVPMGAVMGGAGYGASEIFNRILRSREYVPGIRQSQAKELGIELTPGQKYGDQSLQRIEASMRSDPGYGAPFDVIDAKNQERANIIAGKTIGLDNSKQLTEKEMGSAATKISKMFSRATEAGERVTFDGAWVDDYDSLMANYKKIWGKKDATIPLMDDVWETTIEKGFITPKEYQSYYSQLGKDVEKARKAGDGHEMDLLHGLRKSLDDLLDRNVPGKSSEMQRARNLYKNKLLLEKPGVVRTESGNLSPLILGNKLRKDTRGYLEGENTSDLYNLARVSQGTKSGIGDSGTATRSKVMFDHIKAPIKERVGQLYLSGKAGTNMLGGSTGGGGAVNPYINSLMRGPEVLDALENEER